MDMFKFPNGSIIVTSSIPSLSEFKNLSLAEILDLCVFVSHLIAGDPDDPESTGLLGDDVMNWEIPAVGKTLKYADVNACGWPYAYVFVFGVYLRCLCSFF